MLAVVDTEDVTLELCVTLALDDAVDVMLDVPVEDCVVVGDVSSQFWTLPFENSDDRWLMPSATSSQPSPTCKNPSAVHESGAFGLSKRSISLTWSMMPSHFALRTALNVILPDR